MSGSVWLYNCAMGLCQSDCGKYQKDTTSRGYGRYGGCASCLHRLPANALTEDADDYFERLECLKSVSL